jgi:cell wall assembly regulator SMI1/predicted DNA-binding WGR domain protein
MAARAAKLPSAFKVDIYADVLAATARWIVAGASSSGKLSAWSIDRGAYVIDRPHLEGEAYRAAPKGLAAVSGDRFVMTWQGFQTHAGTSVTSAARLFDLDGAPLGAQVRLDGHELGPCAAHGERVAIATDRGLVAFFTVDDLHAGRGPVHTFDGPRAAAIAFTQDGREVAFVADGVLHRVPFEGGPPTTVPIDVVADARVVSTSSTGLVCASDGSSAVVVRLDGSTVFSIPVPSNAPSANFAQQAMVTPDGGAILVVAGELAKQFHPRVSRGVQFPRPGMEKGHVSVYDAHGVFQGFVPRAKNKLVRALALGPALVIGQDGLAELVSWPLPAEGADRARDLPRVTPAAAPEAAPAHDPISDAAALLARIEAKAAEAGVKLAKGATDDAIAACERALGLSLPAEVRAFYRAHDGAPVFGAVEESELLSLKAIVKSWKIWQKLLADGTFGDNEGEVGPGVQARWWIPEWIPITSDGSGNHHILDLAPGEGGRVGQILSFRHDAPERDVVAPDLLGFLANATWGDQDAPEEPASQESAISAGFRRFEMDAKFWAIQLDGRRFVVRFGKQGTDGQEKIKEFADAPTAQREHDKLVAEKVKKGYREI